MSKGLIFGGFLASVALAMGLYLPKRGYKALQSAYEQYQQCPRPHIEWAPGTGTHADPESRCFEAYMTRREEILWRYFFFQTLAKRL